MTPPPRTLSQQIEGLAKEANPGPWCPDLTSASVRHVIRNCNIDCSAHPNSPWCETFGKYDGELVALLGSNIPTIVKALAYWEQREKCDLDGERRCAPCFSGQGDCEKSVAQK